MKDEKFGSFSNDGMENGFDHRSTGVSLVQSVPMRLVIVKVAYGLQGHAHVYFARRMKCPRKDPPGRIAGYFHKTKVKQGKLSDDTSF